MIGVKMLTSGWIHPPAWLALGLITFAIIVAGYGVGFWSLPQ